MPRNYLSAGLIVVTAMVLSSLGAWAGTDLQQPADPKAVAAAPSGLDLSNGIKPFTITATLREEYDDNIFTAKTGRVGSFKTDFSPSVLVDLPMEDSDFSARYTFGLVYYSNRPGNSTDTSQNFVAQYKHSFSDRFNLNLAEQFLYSTEPSLLTSTGTLYRSGAYYVNTINAGFNAQWTPLFGTTSTFSNTVVRYEENTQAIEQNSIENTGAQNFNFAILPKITAVVGGIIDDITYQSLSRGYTNYTGNAGIDWQALPTLSLGARVGGSYTQPHAYSSGTTSPYGALTVSWQLGARSSLNFAYVHEVVPTDVYVAQGQIADRFDTTFKYDITKRLTAHLESVYTYGQYTSALLNTSTLAPFDESDLVVDTGLAYHVNNYFDVETGYIFSGVFSGEGYRDYTRDQVYIGVRGTY